MFVQFYKATTGGDAQKAGVKRGSWFFCCAPHGIRPPPTRCCVLPKDPTRQTGPVASRPQEPALSHIAQADRKVPSRERSWPKLARQPTKFGTKAGPMWTPHIKSLATRGGNMMVLGRLLSSVAQSARLPRGRCSPEAGSGGVLVQVEQFRWDPPNPRQDRTTAILITRAARRFRVLGVREDEVQAGESPLFVAHVQLLEATRAPGQRWLFSVYL